LKHGAVEKQDSFANLAIKSGCNRSRQELENPPLIITHLVKELVALASFWFLFYCQPQQHFWWFMSNISSQPTAYGGG